MKKIVSSPPDSPLRQFVLLICYSHSVISYMYSVPSKVHSVYREGNLITTNCYYVFCLS